MTERRRGRGRRRRAGRCHRSPRASRGPATRSSSWSGRRRGAGGPVGSSPRPPHRGPAPDRPGRADAGAVAGPIPAMRVETPAGATFRLTYGDDAGGESAVGFDRSRLDPALLELAARPGQTSGGAAVTDGRPRRGALDAPRPDGDVATLRARVVVGADGPLRSSRRAAGVARPARLDRGSGSPTTCPTRPAGAPRRPDGRPRDGYVGIAPVPAAGSTSGSCSGARGGRRSPARAPGPSSRDPRGHPGDRRRPGALAPAGHRPTRSRAPGRSATACHAGPGGAGCSSATRPGSSTRSPARASTGPRVGRARRGRRPCAGCAGGRRAFAAYDREMRRRFLAEGRRVVARPGLPRASRACSSTPRGVSLARAEVRATMGLVMGDLVPAARALDPRFLAALLAP